MDGSNDQSISTEYQGLNEGSQRIAAISGNFQPHNNARDDRRAREPLPRGGGGRAATRGNNDRATSYGKRGSQSNDREEDWGETQGTANRYNLRSLKGENNTERPTHGPVERDRQANHTLPYTPLGLPDDTLRFVYSYGYGSSPRIDKTYRFNGSQKSPFPPIEPRIRIEKTGPWPSKSDKDSPTRRSKSPSTFRFRSGHPIPSTESSDTASTGPRKGLKVSKKAKYRSGYEKRRDLKALGPPAPCATDVYLAQAKLPCVRLKSPQRLLLVIDLNGTLIARRSRSRPSMFYTRPGLDRFFSYIFAHHSVMIYTSSKPWTVSIVFPKLFTDIQREQLVAVFTRDDLDLTPEQYMNKVQVYKRLEKVWGNEEVQSRYSDGGSGKQSGGAWNQTNTVMIDDSELKALSQPHNLLRVPEFTPNVPKKEQPMHERVPDELILKLEQLKWQTDVSRLIRLWQIGEAEVPTVKEGNTVAEADEEEDGGVALTTAGIGNMSVGQQETTREMSVGQQSDFSAGQSREMSVGQETEADAERASETEREMSVGQ